MVSLDFGEIVDFTHDQIVGEMAILRQPCMTVLRVIACPFFENQLLARPTDQFLD